MRGGSKPDTAGHSPPAPLTPAQNAALLDALRQHPKIYAPRARAVASRLVAAGLFASSGEGFRLSAAGLDLGARLSAQQVIDAVNKKRAMRESEPTSTSPNDSSSDGRPVNWPFPISAHDWTS